MIMNVSGKINLLQLYGAIKSMKGQSGMMDCLIIPIKKNNLFHGENGVYLDLIGFEMKNKKEGSKDTHIVKQSLPKEIREQMSDDDLKAMPILGNFQVWGSGNQTESAPLTDPKPINEKDDLPF